MEGLRTILFLLTIFVTLSRYVAAEKQNRPHIIYILADDLGWNDVGFTGNSDLQTPNLDALAYNGRILTRHYTQTVCTPSRTALFTGRYPIRSGMQGFPMIPPEPRALSLNEKLLPQYFKDLGYQTHLVGKWHLGFYDWKYLPTTRCAFDTFFGYLNGFIGYYDHTIVDNIPTNVTAHDFWRNLEPQYQLRGRYVTDLLTEESIRLIEAAGKNDKSDPLFLFISHLAIHAGNPGDNDLEYPVDDLDRFSYILDIRRRKLAAMAWNLDKSVGEVVKALADNNMLNNSIIVFASDNGAQTIGIFQNDGSNYPFRGLKATLFEGGIHTTAFIWSKDLHGKGISRQLFHLTDWLPTLFHAAGGNVRELTGLDGRDQWENLLQKSTGDLDKDEYAGREELLVNIEDVTGQQSVIYRNWKLVSGTINNGEFDTWFGDYRNVNYEYKTTHVSQSPVSMALSSLPFNRTSDENMLKIRNQAQIRCDYTTTEVACNLVEAACLFDLSTDPCERVNLNASRPDIVMQLTAKLQTYSSQMKPQLNVADDNAAYTHIVNNTWMPWQGTKNSVLPGKTPCGTINVVQPGNNSAKSIFESSKLFMLCWIVVELIG